MKKILFIISACLMLISCIYTEITHLSESDLAWMSVYNVNDSVLLASQEEVDTLIILNKTIYNSLNPFRENEGFSKYKANANYDYELRHKNRIIEGWFNISKEEKASPIHLNVQLHERFGFNLNMNLSKRKIGRVILDDCIVIDDNNSELSKYHSRDTILEYFVWSKSKGLVEFKFRYEDVYVNESVSITGTGSLPQ